MSDKGKEDKKLEELSSLYEEYLGETPQRLVAREPTEGIKDETLLEENSDSEVISDEDLLNLRSGKYYTRPRAHSFPSSSFNISALPTTASMPPLPSPPGNNPDPPTNQHAGNNPSTSGQGTQSSSSGGTPTQSTSSSSVQPQAPQQIGSPHQGNA